MAGVAYHHNMCNLDLYKKTPWLQITAPIHKKSSKIVKRQKIWLLLGDDTHSLLQQMCSIFVRAGITNVMAFIIAGQPHVCSTACSGQPQRRHQRSVSLQFEKWIF